MMHFFTRIRRKDLNVHYSSESYFNLSKRTLGNNSNTIILPKKALEDVESNVDVLLGLKWIMMSLRIFVEKHGNLKLEFICILIDVNRKVTVIFNSRKNQEPTYNINQKQPILGSSISLTMQILFRLLSISPIHN